MKRCGFTLVELLVVMTILAILSSMVLFALSAAQESAREMKTRATINKLNAIVMAKWESYRTRRVPVRSFTQEGTGDLNGNGQQDTYTIKDVAAYRLQAIHELMRLEMPDSFFDIDDPPVTPTIIGGSTPMQRPTLNVQFQSKIPPAAQRTTKTIAAECLYLVVMSDPDAQEQFAADEIDVAADGMKMFVDGRGRPIYFLRWAPAFDSPLQSHPSTEHDPFDPLVTNASGFPLYPLIYSAGPDGIYDITAEKLATPIRWAAIKNNPFDASVVGVIGKQEDANGDGELSFADNITNHDLIEK